jgi:hypothetical protein
MGDDADLHSVVHLAFSMLAAGAIRAGALSDHLGVAVAIPHRRNRSGWSPRAGKGDYLAAGAGATRSTTRVTEKSKKTTRHGWEHDVSSAVGALEVSPARQGWETKWSSFPSTVGATHSHRF